MEPRKNNAGLYVQGSKNPNYKGGHIDKVCQQCNNKYKVRRPQIKSKYCSMKCVGESQKGKRTPHRQVIKACEICKSEFSIAKSHSHRQHCCSKACSYKRRSLIMAADKNPNWNGGVSRLPYPFDWNQISRSVRHRDGNYCRNPKCTGDGRGKIGVHHIDYDKMNVQGRNLITICTICNTKANFGRSKWESYYISLLRSIHPILFE